MRPALAALGEPVIRYNDLTTWPDEAVKRLRAHSAKLVKYAEREDELDDMSSIDRHWQSNDFDHDYKDACAQLTRILAEHLIVGVHYTRLALDEIDAIKSKGIRISSVDFARERIHRRVEAGDLTASQGHELLTAQVYDKPLNGRRLGMYWICVGGGTPHEGAIYRLLHHWGGEAIYVDHERKPLGRLLRQIGEPCVVEVAVKPQHLQCYGAIGERFVASWIKRKRRQEDNGFEGHVTCDLEPNHVLRVITRHDPDFDRLTGVSAWEEPPW